MGNFTPVILDVLALLADTFEIYLKNVRLMGFLAALIICFHTMLYLINIFSIRPLIFNLIDKISLLFLGADITQTDFLTGLREDIIIIVGVECIFLLLSAIASMFFTVSTTHASAFIHGGENTSIKDLALRTIRSIKRPFITCFYIILLGLGVISVCLIALPPVVLIFGENVILSSSYSGMLLSLPILVFYTNLSVLWNLSLVVSILEDKSGIEALGKAAEIIKGMKLLGFILSLVLATLSLVLLHVFRWMVDFYTQPEAMIIVMGLLMLNSIQMVGMFGDVAFTVLYYECKKSHGQEVEIDADQKEYTKITTAPLLNENNIP